MELAVEKSIRNRKYIGVPIFKGHGWIRTRCMDIAKQHLNMVLFAFLNVKHLLVFSKLNVFVFIYCSKFVVYVFEGI